MRKFIIAAVFSLLSFAAFAQLDLSLGAGGYYSPYLFVGRIETPATWTQSQSFYGFYGAKAFCDLTFVSADIGILRNTDQSTITTSTSSSTSSTTTGQLSQGTWLSVGAIGKFPFKSGDLRVYPLIGIEYDVLLGMVNAAGQDLMASMTDTARSNLNRLWLKAGVGADIDVGGKYFFRPEADFCYKLPSSLDTEQIDLAKTAGNVATRTYLKLDISFSVGYRF